jgi:hypothetical protein
MASNLKLKLECRKLPKGKKAWFIVGIPPGWHNKGDLPEYGPYKDKEEAQSDIQGLKNFAEKNPDYL